MGNSKSSSFRGCWRLWGTYSICDALSPDPCSNLSWTFQITALFDWEDPPDPPTAAYRTNIDQPCFLSANLPFNIAVGEYIGYSRPVIAFNCFLFGCYFVISTILIVNIIRSHIENMDLQIRQDAYNRLQEYTNQVENMYSSLRSFKHDYNNIMLSISGYIESEDMDGLKSTLIRKSLR